MSNVQQSSRGGWYFGWNVVAATIVMQVASNGLTINAYPLFLKSWSAAFGAPISTLQLGMGMCGIACAIGAPITGMFADRYPARALVVPGLILTALFFFGISLATSTWQYLVLYGAVSPLALCLSGSVPANAVLSRWFSKRLGLALGLSGFGLGATGIVLPPILAVAIPALGWRMVWQIGGLLVVAIALPFAWLGLRNKPQPSDGFAYIGSQNDEAARAHCGLDGEIPSLGRIFASRTFWLLILTYSPMMAIYGGCGQNIAPIAATRGLGEGTASLMLSLFCAAQLLATLAAGMASDRIGNRIPLGAFAFVAATGAALVALGTNGVTLALGIMMAGMGGAFWPLLASALATEFGPRGVGRGFGMVTLFLPLSVLAPFGVARTQELLGSYVPPLLFLTALGAGTGLLCLLFMHEKRRGTVTGEIAVTA